MPQSRPFLIGYGTIIALVIIFLANKVSFIFQPIVILVQTLFFPFLVSGVLYYLFRPIVNYLYSLQVPRLISILSIYILFIGLLVLLGFLLGPPLKEQLTRLIENFPHILETAQKKFIELNQQPWVSQNIDWNEISKNVTNYLKDSFVSIGANIAGFFGLIANIVVVFVTVPFILYYMLKEGEKAPSYMLRILPKKEREEGLKILSAMDSALSSYIKGQILVSVFVGIIVYIGYLIIGIDYALILALATMLTNVIPFIGPLIGMVPALIVGFIDSPIMVVKVLIVAVIAQQLEGNLVSPYVMGKSLNIHPLTIIVILLVAGSLGGFLGLLLAVPTYAVLKVVIYHIYRLWRLHQWNRRGEKSL
ncbi:AI-2E family transporter [Hazenella coriacea]|uniref:Putative PurR-regulated permease PerM n=1 Tax=Hazenella coriacea TaxID=1179467 RepID=A0A4R3LB55_9BACL|nr:AI-2E family transporter [Hazenella coriacea]TCS96999.1 putative PurR-regulated permease PerM [Hazenella coriacea]